MKRLPMDWRRLVGLERALSGRNSAARAGRVRPVRVGVRGAGPLRGDLDQMLPGLLGQCGAGLVLAETDAPVDLLFVALSGTTEPARDELARARAEFPKAALLAVPASDEADLARSLLAGGADDVLLPPLGGGLLVTALERQRRILMARTGAVSGQGAGQIVAVVKAGGGVGATFLAGQLACLGTEVGTAALIDLDFAAGTCALDFDIAANLSAFDVVGQDGAAVDMALADVLPQTPSGLRLLPAPWPGTMLESLTPDEVRDLMDGLRSAFDLSVIDLPGGLSPMGQAVVAEADVVLLVMAPSLAHVARGRLLLEQLSEARREAAAPVMVVVNRVVRGAGLSQSDVRAGLGRAPDAWLVEDRVSATEAQERGRRIGDVAAGTRIARAIDALAVLVSEAGSETRIQTHEAAR